MLQWLALQMYKSTLQCIILYFPLSLTIQPLIKVLYTGTSKLSHVVQISRGWCIGVMQHSTSAFVCSFVFVFPSVTASAGCSAEFSGEMQWWAVKVSPSLGSHHLSHTQTHAHHHTYPLWITLITLACSSLLKDSPNLGSVHPSYTLH